MTKALTIFCRVISLLSVGCGPNKEQIEEKRFRSWADSDFEKVVASVEGALKRIRKEGWVEGTIPVELDYLKPERIFVHERGIIIETFISLDSSVGLMVFLSEDGKWIVSLFVNEHDKPEEIWKGSGYANQAAYIIRTHSAGTLV